MTTGATSNLVRVREDFPILAREVHGKPLVYLDSAATSQKPTRVLDAMDAYYRETNANVHRGVYELAAEATARFEAGRDAIARLVGSPREGVVFTKNASEAINLVAWAWGVRTLKPGDEILVTEMEHHSNIVPWQIVAKITGATLRFAPITGGGELDLDAFGALISERTKMVAVVHASNVLGTINPVAEIGALAKAHGALVLVDGSQSVPHMPVSFDELGCDFLAFTGHKMCGPTGIGVLVGRVAVLDAMEPFLGGGEMIREVTAEGSTWNDLPYKFEAGTPPIAEAVGIGAAADYLMAIGLDHVRAHEREMAAALIDGLASVPDITIYGPMDPDRRGAAVSFSLPDIHPHDIAQLLDQEGVAVRAGHHCAKPLMRVLGINATARASAYVYNTPDDVDVLVRGLASARRYLRST
ncbi:MAG: cysteine desulfurase [Actinobacteria bacterium]|nr:cysteine desulfurase [Actinomycetota bacterium]